MPEPHTAEKGLPRVRVAFTMQRSDYEQIKAEAEREGLTFAALLRKAIATRRYLDQRVKSGATVLTEQDGIQREVVFR